jgi:tetratricopeptide (TPR) repeat protein
LIDGKPEVLSALVEQERGRFADSERLWLKLEKSAMESKDAALLEHCQYWLSRLYADRGAYDKAIPYYTEFLKEKDGQRREDRYRALAWNEAELGDLYFKSRAWSTAAAHYDKALEEWFKYSRVPETIGVLHKVALCHWHSGDGADPKTAFESARKMYEKMLFMPALRGRRWRFDVDAALMLDDFARYLAVSGDKSASAEVGGAAEKIWRQLSDLGTVGEKPQPVIGNAGALGVGLALSLDDKAEILKRLAEHFCLVGRKVEAMQVYDTWFDLRANMLAANQSIDSAARAELVRELYRSKEKCLAANSKFTSADADVAGPSNQQIAGSENPYLSEFNSIRSQQECFDRHQELCHKYAWAVPNQAALEALRQNQPIIEIGAGTGYWAHLLRQIGVKIAAYDLNPVPSSGNQWHSGAGRSWATVLSGDETAVRRSSAQALFLCWPPEVNQCAYNALRLFKGNTVIYVGEGPGGCSGTAKFHSLLARDWDLVGQIEIPQWPGVYDGLFVYMRKRASTAVGEGSATRDLRAQSGKDSGGKRGLALRRNILGVELADTAERSATVVDDLSALLDSGVKVRFVEGPCRAYFDQRERTIKIAKSCSASRKLLAIAHEYAHALLNPTAQPVANKIGRQEFVELGMQDEADAIVHELVVARELRRSGVALDPSTERLLDAFNNKGRMAVINFLNLAKNSVNDESYETHFGRWYDEVVKPAAIKR